MTTIIQLSAVRTPARVLEARQIEQIRRDCVDSGLNAHQVQKVLARARKSLRKQAANTSSGNAMQGVLERAKAWGVSSFTLLDGLQAVLRELASGRSSATAYQVGVSAMRPHGPARGADGGIA